MQFRISEQAVERELLHNFLCDTPEMFFAVQVPRRCLLTKRARQIYGLSAAVFVFLCPIVIFAPIGPSALRLVLVPYSLACATLWVSMWYYWFTVHPANSLGKGYWGLVMLIGPPGCLIYFLIVYLRHRSPVVQEASAASASA